MTYVAKKLKLDIFWLVSVFTHFEHPFVQFFCWKHVESYQREHLTEEISEVGRVVQIEKYEVRDDCKRDHKTQKLLDDGLCGGMLEHKLQGFCVHQ